MTSSESPSSVTSRVNGRNLCWKAAFQRKALDPVATAKIEELITESKRDFTIVIVTRNMQQAGRCSDYRAFLYLGHVVEFGDTRHLFRQPQQRQTEDYISGRFG